MKTSPTTTISAKPVVCALVLAVLASQFEASRGALGAHSHSQSGYAPSPGPAFDVASVRQNKSVGERRNWQVQPGGRFTATNMPLRALIRMAYGFNTLILPSQQIVNGPDWIDTDRFDIAAKTDAPLPAENATSREVILHMLRALLNERFKLRAHTEQRELPIFELVRGRKDGKLGPQLSSASGACAGAAGNNDGAAGDARCGISSPGPGVLIGRNVPLFQLVAFLQLSPAVGRVVRDRTDLQGNYDFRLDYVPPLVQGPTGGFNSNPAAETGLSLLTALQEQLGLKLEAKRGPVEVLVIDSIERLSDQQ